MKCKQYLECVCERLYMFVHDVSMLGIMLLTVIYNVRESDICTHILQNAC